MHNITSNAMGVGFLEKNTTKNKRFTVQPIISATENRAKCCQNSGRDLALAAALSERLSQCTFVERFNFARKLCAVAHGTISACFKGVLFPTTEPSRMHSNLTDREDPMRVTQFIKLPLVPDQSLDINPSAVDKAMKSAPRQRYFILCLFMALLLAFNTSGARAQEPVHAPEYTSIVVFGDSLSDTGNVAHLTYDKYGVRIPGPDADYTDGRFTDGADTLPSAEKYFGVWIEQLAAKIPSKPEIKDSLDGGTDYAYGFATTGSGTGSFTFGPSDSLSVNVDNIGQQITDYLATHPKIDDKTLFVVWGGAIDVLYATSQDNVIDAGINQTLNIQRLIDAGATQFIVPNLPPLGLVPRLNGSSTTSIPATEASALYNTVLCSGIGLLHDFNHDKRLQIAQLDVFALFNKIVNAPANYSLANITDSSQGMAVDPDTYLFWDDLHPTTRGHHILAITAARLLAQRSKQGISASSGNVGSAFHSDVAVQFSKDLAH